MFSSPRVVVLRVDAVVARVCDLLVCRISMCAAIDIHVYNSKVVLLMMLMFGLPLLCVVSFGR